MDSSKIVLEQKHVCDIKGTFYVPSYQRGYRWGKEEVRRLLDDVYSNGAKGYGLQPVVVRKKADCYELIDGQQRLTTLYLIYRYMNNVTPSFFSGPAFSLIYETRKKSAEFLQNIDTDRRDENIDFWFITNAYEAIKEWFEEDIQIRLMDVFKYFKQFVYIIWYEIGECEDAISLFTRLNIGKIYLTNAELVKALFLANNGRHASDRKKQEEISLQWDAMEKELHNDSFWYFLANRTNASCQTRIDLILDLISHKPADNREKYYTFFEINERAQTMPADDLWREIQLTFLTLKSWFEHHELFHKIGYLIASEKRTLQEIFKISHGKTKTDFLAALDDCIRDSIAIHKNYAELSYDNSYEYKRISTLLLLFNVESVRQNGEQTQWFPFDKFKFGQKGKAAWSLEHIHARQSEGLRTQEMWKEWLKLHVPSVRAVSKQSDQNSADLLEEDIQKAIDNPKLDRAEFDKLQQRIIDLLSVKGNDEYLHSISNLALLRSDNNAALSNSAFDVKRNKIIELDKEGQYIPFCTKMAFLKYYTPSEKNQVNFWGQADRIAYVEAMNRVLDNYLSEKISVEKEELI